MQTGENFTPEQVGIIKRTICKGATDDELELFLVAAARTGLDPFSRQIYAIRRKTYDKDTKSYKETQVVQASVDGLRVIAERSGKYAGQLGPYWCGADGVWKEVWLEEFAPAAAKVGILRTDFREPLWAVARFEAYSGTDKDGKLTAMWSRLGDVMIAKVAESLGLRKAFPQDLSGIYTTEEMDQADNQKPVPPKPPTKDENASRKPEHTTEPLTDFETGEVHTPEADFEKAVADLEKRPTVAEVHALADFATANGWSTDYLTEYSRNRYGDDYRKTMTKLRLGEIKAAIIESAIHPEQDTEPETPKDEPSPKFDFGA